MVLTLSTVAADPKLVTYSLTLTNGNKAILRPLEADDVNKLDDFLSGLSEETKRLITAPDADLPTATELCDAINKYDKLRFVLEATPENRIIGLLEFSFGIPDGDIRRFKTASYMLDENTDCRFGPTLADNYQNKGLGTSLFSYITEIARQFGKKRIILWGGVLKDNARAVHYYKKHGFKIVGTFSDKGDEMLDMILNLD